MHVSFLQCLINEKVARPYHTYSSRSLLKITIRIYMYFSYVPKPTSKEYQSFLIDLQCKSTLKMFLHEVYIFKASMLC